MTVITLVLCFFLFLCVLIILNTHRYYFSYKEKSVKQETVLNFYFWWKYKADKGISISKSLREQGYKTIAVYGLGKLGKSLIYEMRCEGMDVSYCVDNGYAESTYEGIQCFKPNCVLPQADILIISVITAPVEKIKNDIVKIGSNIEVIRTIQEVLYESM